MTTPKEVALMAESSIPVDLLNPGQVLACLGLLEAAHVLLSEAEGAFDWSQARPRFHLRAKGDTPPVTEVLRFLTSAQAFAIKPFGSELSWTASWGNEPKEPKAAGYAKDEYPFREPQSPATLVCVLESEDRRLVLDYWGDSTRRDNFKLWAGSAGYPGAGLTRDALALLRDLDLDEVAGDPFAFSRPQSSSFRLDWRRDYISIDLGFSLNRHANMTPAGFPLVELLAAVGLTHARPTRTERRNKLHYRYGVIGRAEPGDSCWLPLSLLRAALGGAMLPFPRRTFQITLGWPGQEGQARSITQVREEPRS